MSTHNRQKLLTTSQSTLQTTEERKEITCRFDENILHFHPITTHSIPR